jgi:hypothetical protein
MEDEPIRVLRAICFFLFLRKRCRSADVGVGMIEGALLEPGKVEIGLCRIQETG